MNMPHTKKHQNPKEQLAHYLHIARVYAPLAFIVFLFAIYGFLAWRIFSLMSAAPDPSIVDSKVQAVGVKGIDPNLVSKMQHLEDNSVSVQTLFDQARQNPFSE
jgi:hypothetical protein